MNASDTAPARFLDKLPQLLASARAALLPVLLALVALAPPAAWAAEEPVEPPMRFVIVRANPGQCAPGCPEWISAEGRITDKTPGEFKRILKKMGKRKLPLVIVSGGGDVEGAFALGRLIRSRKLDVAVGMTVFAGCRPEDKKCKLPEASNGAYLGKAYSTMTYCYSACPLVLAAGTRRLGGEWVDVGVHQVTTIITTTRLTYKTRYKIVKGKKVLEKRIVGRKNLGSRTTTKLGKAARKRMIVYLQEMGIDPALMAAIETTSAQDIRKLEQEEMLKLGLITGLESVDELTMPAICSQKPVADNCFVVAEAKTQ